MSSASSFFSHNSLGENTLRTNAPSLKRRRSILEPLSQPSAAAPPRKRRVLTATSQKENISEQQPTCTNTMTSFSRRNNAQTGVLPANKRTCPALQTLHIKALEYGLRVPINNTPLGILDQAENIIYNRMHRPMIARLSISQRSSRRRVITSPPVLSLLPIDIIADANLTSVPALSTASIIPVRPRRHSRRNSTGCLELTLLLEM
ncbi:hypothetical protein BX661DRAFT_184204 [Kickxella alabastrina]|uniref:uncharacterized protein n=1 Tax=Kickxella alabastrina TaxID=61397 RepID=UPI00221F0F73|nr:uncharacterized protein BX661DRAFT_184204 [Kickxella alabastrina]KAI7825807.1 hypothetical protein BX661DRAFT_184204 [Kickxella alabastrina]